MSDITELIARIAEAAADDDDHAASERAAITQKHRTPSQIAEHRRLHRLAKRHVEEVDAHNENNPEKPRKYNVELSAYSKIFAYVEQDT